MSKILFGGEKVVKVEVQNHRKIVLSSSFKEVDDTLRTLSSIFGDRPIGSITNAELADAIFTITKLNALRTESKARRRICGK